MFRSQCKFGMFDDCFLFILEIVEELLILQALSILSFFYYINYYYTAELNDYTRVDIIFLATFLSGIAVELFMAAYALVGRIFAN